MVSLPMIGEWGLRALGLLAAKFCVMVVDGRVCVMIIHA